MRPLAYPAHPMTSNLRIILVASSACLLLASVVGGCQTASAARRNEQHLFMLQSARTAWAYVSRNAPDAGFAPAHETYKFVTVWDIASNLAATYSARELGIIAPPQYDARMHRLLGTLRTMPLYDGAAPNKLYASGNATMVDRAALSSRVGYGWSVVDVGRLLIWLRIVAKDSAHAAAARAVVARFDMNRMVANGYLQGADIDPETLARETYQEGRIGYEQYAAEGFALW